MIAYYAGGNTMHYKKIVLACAMFTVLGVSTLTGCSKSDTKTPTQTDTSQSTDASSETTTNTIDYTNVIKGNELIASYDEDDLNTNWKETSYKSLSFSDTTINSEGAGITVNGQTATISAAGTYHLTGTSTNSTLVVDAGKEDIVWLVLDGITMTHDSNAPIYVKNAKKVIITLADGSTNTISDGSTYTYADSTTTDPDAAIFSHDDLTFNGSGSLTVTGNYKDAIACKDELKFVNGTYTITAADDGIRGKDGLFIQNGNFTITAAADGLKANNDTDDQKGVILIEDGTFVINATNDAIQAETSMWIKGGKYTLTTNGGSANAAQKTPEQGGRFDPNQGNTTTDSQADTQTDSQTTDTTSDSYKGLKAGCDLYITGGAFNIDSADDALHTNHTVTIDGGTFMISTGDDGMHADDTLTINDGNIQITKSYEGLEGNDILINGGTIQLTASDDGINAAGGSDGTTEGGGFGRDQFSSSGNHSLTITGGYLEVNADGDGLDSNGTITQSGGTVIVNGPTNGGNGALDYDSAYNITGGILLASGSKQMAQTTSDTSTQASIYLSFTDTKTAGTLLTLTDSSGTPIFSFAPKKNYESIVISSPDIKTGETYTLYLDGSNSGTGENGLILGGTYTPGSKVLDITTTSVLTQLTDTGETTTASGDGMGGGGGGRGERPNGGTKPDGMTKPDGTENQTPPDGMTPPDGSENQNLPDGMTPPSGAPGEIPNSGEQTTPQA